ncbi:hypothetical protein GQ43DRAFT_471639 [Delitschia confertaspora ATCC 74209]|uniref:AP-1 complex subunit sigma-1 n=1 Tax=Delitschia confertaspora ATCC 74209 TaxID=1513339 RepID=A0A9P4MZ74_9PLEO|nr:hypothetical protein GQ43DRAFT_471639 [Delitschia confertaspora ATCC 74209]
MAIKYLILLSRQGKVRLAKWFTTLAPKDKAKIVKDVSQLVLARRTRMCNFLEYKDTKIVYRRYASLFFIAGCDSTDNELITLEIVHRYVEQMDKYYGNVCELDIIFNFQKAYFILDELLLAGELQESSKKNVLRCIGQQDSLEDMEYLDLCAFHEVTQALSFDTDSCSIIGGCDAYTVKAAGSDKKLYKDIDNHLEKRHEELKQAHMSMPMDHQGSFARAMNLARQSPFGSLDVPANRKKFAYVIATLNATHPDYEFSHILKPEDFTRENQQLLRENIDTTMYNLRPQFYQAGLPTGAMTPYGSPIWSPKMWKLIDSEMELAECEYYSWEPETDPFDGEDGAIWSYHYFVYNKEKKRMCYIYFRGISALSNSPVPATSLIDKYKHSIWSEYNVSGGAKKRAEFWLGDGARDVYEEYDNGLDNLVIDHPGEVVDAEEFLSVRDRETSMDYYSDEDDSDIEIIVQKSKSPHCPGRGRSRPAQMFELEV